MQNIEKFHVRFDDFDSTPYYQASPDNRIRISCDNYNNKNWKHLKNLIYTLFHEDSETNLTLEVGTIRNNKRIPIKTGIGKFFHITNWKEDIVYHSELDMSFIIATIKNVDADDIYKYGRRVASGHKDSYIVFYNQTFLMYISTDVIDIISKEKEDIQKVTPFTKELFKKS
ncbi:hypothetical protein [Sinobaca sp. H24]|uniref:hypothetical protein n=1 Tax=Sinobaca sp. H24 TaxID=2923376 RepID=UPI0020797BF2|nr:hypothetical protein [Sinobaca sp. H24]